MDSFEDIHRRHITGSLAMFDRMIFKGHLSHLFKPDAVRALLWAQGYPITDFTEYAKATTNRIANNVDRLAAESGRPRISFDHVKTRNRTQMKDDLAKSIAADDGITEGIVCFISAAEPCMSFQVRKSDQTHRIEVTRRERKCLHHYMYLIDPEFGFMHVRIQGWIPYEVQIYINGREWLARQLDKAGIGYVRYENSLLAIDDLERAAKLCERFAHRAWPRVLNAFARRLNPLMASIARAGFGGYYWVLDQAEIATDVMFKSPSRAPRGLARPGPSRRLEHVGRRRPRLLGPKAPPEPRRRPGRHRHQASAPGLAGPPPRRGQLGQGLRQGLGASRRDDHQQSARVPSPAHRHRRAGASGGGAPCEKGSATCGATTRWGSVPTAATSTPSLPPPSRAKVSPPSMPCAGPEPPEGGPMPASTR